MSTWEMQFFRLGEIIARKNICTSSIKSLKSITLLKKIYQYWDLLYFYQKNPRKNTWLAWQEFTLPPDLRHEQSNLQSTWNKVKQDASFTIFVTDCSMKQDIIV